MSGMTSLVQAAGVIEQKMETVANNLANVNTVGFKEDQTSFREVLSTVQRVVPESLEERFLSHEYLDDYVGMDKSAVIVDEVGKNFEPGRMRSTGNDLDFAIANEGFFTIETPQGERFTRNGHFEIDSEGRIVTSEGFLVLGEKGATRSYGPQKGICVNDIDVHESRLKRLADVVENELNLSIRNDKGAGAAGGLGFGLKAFCDATLVNGFDLISEMTSLEEAVMSSDLIITGEGSIDAQSMMGKAPFGVAKLAHKHNKPVVAFCGILKDEEALGNVFDKVFPMVDSEVSVEEAINDSSKVLKNKVDSCRLMIEQLVS